MQNYLVKLESPVSKSFRCQKAANSLDIDVAKKSVHEFQITADIESKFSVGLIVGASGSGKTSLAKHIFGDQCFESTLAADLPIIDQLPKNLSYDECAAVLTGIGLTSVPCWIRPVHTLSNGQRARAEAALLMANQGNGVTVIDEWSSVVDRTVAKVMSHCVQKHARAAGRRVVLVSCHYDVIEWLNPDWIIDCNKGAFIDRRSLPGGERQRSEQLHFKIAEVDRSTWNNFSKYHYLSDRMAGGLTRTFGLFHGQNQIGFQAFTNYVAHKDKTKPMIMHFNRTVIHPDYAGLGLGIRMINETSKIVRAEGFRVMGKFSSVPVYRSLLKCPEKWRLLESKIQIGKMRFGNLDRRNRKNLAEKSGFRENVKTYSFEYVE